MAIYLGAGPSVIYQPRTRRLYLVRSGKSPRDALKETRRQPISLSSLFSKLTASVSVPAIEHDDLQRACLDGSCTIVDVREPHEYAAGHIPGAVNYPLSRFEPRRLPEDKAVVLVCLSDARSAKALQRALAAGRQNIRHYPPGTAGWKTRGGDLARPKHDPNEL